jgi:iron complex outermembrane recepter protein
MKRNGNLRLLATILLAAAIPCPGFSAESATEADLELEPVLVTGSHIPRILTEGPSPVTIITAEDMTARGFTTVEDAVKSLTQVTGVTQNETMGGTFTQNANSIGLRDLGPGRTLVLIDGHREAEYPQPYNSESNFVNISAIPAAAIDRIELLSSGASAIYGSDAVAGVVNVILKNKLDDQFNLDVRTGDTTQGGGRSTRIQLVTGFNTERLNTLFAFEYFDRAPVYAFQRKFQDSSLDNPNPDAQFFSRSILRLDWYNGVYIDPGVDACDQFPNLSYTERVDRGFFCGDPLGNSQHTLQNARSRGSLYSRFTYDLGGNADLYGSLRLYTASDRYDPDYTWFSSDCLTDPGCNGGFLDVSPEGQASDQDGFGGTLSTMQRLFQPYEIGGYKARQYRDNEKVTDFNVGVRGGIAGDWRFDMNFAGSRYNFRERAPQLLNAPLRDYFLGDPLTDANGDLLLDPEYEYYLVYAPDWSKLYARVTPATYNSFIGINKSKAYSSSTVGSVVLNGSLFDLPAGRVEAAVVLETARQSYEITLDPRLVAGEFSGLVGTGGGGNRKRHAAGLELSVPVIEQLRMKLAGRYDKYDDITEVDDAITYNFGLEYRPIRQLLVRGSYATSFRAPDMHYVFADPSGFFTSVTDEYLCRADGQPPSGACTILSGASISGARQGNPFLKEETSKSWTYGIVAQPLRNLTVSADYYYVKLEDGVKDNSEERLLQTEADCRLGQTIGGVPVDINSLKCQAAIAHVNRRPPGGAQGEFIESVVTGPINASMLKTSGIDAALAYSMSAGNLGKFTLNTNYSTVLSYKEQEFAGDPAEDRLKDLQYFGWHSRMSAGLTWEKNDFTSTLFAQRFGSVPNWAETGRIGSWTIANLSGRYSGLLGGEVYVGFAVNNLFDRKPPRDSTFDTYPYYSDSNYDPIGREVFLEIGTRF